MSNKLALVIEHDAMIHLGELEHVLRERGYEIQVVKAREGLSEVSASAADLVVILGNDHGVYDDRDYIAAEKSWLAAWLTQQKPTLGVCFGAQILADTLGGNAHRGDHTVIGYREIEPTPEGLSSPLRHFAGIPALEWHGDTFTLPPGATRLAGSTDYANEAFAVDDWLLAVQFHPEASTEMFEQWLEDGRESVTELGLDDGQLRQESVSNAPAMHRASRLMVSEWLDSVERTR